ncbi:MAG: VOC family protein [Tannerellaceae bacterium]|jgi:PhnB protein|nr:VOC family protein [Tannerellaceae bacterium]
MIEVSPYLQFNGDCEVAFAFYKSVFGGEFEFLYRYKDVPTEKPLSEWEKEKIMHISLPLMKGVNLLGMDVLDVAEKSIANRITIGIRTNNEEDTLRIFNALATDGDIIQPLQKAFFADLFGSVTDKFGFNWSINCNIGKQ